MRISDRSGPEWPGSEDRSRKRGGIQSSKKTNGRADVGSRLKAVFDAIDADLGYTVGERRR